jgi:hypothetical protein
MAVTTQLPTRTYIVTGTTQSCAILLTLLIYEIFLNLKMYKQLFGLHSYVQCFWDYPITFVGTTQLRTILLGLHNYIHCFWDHTSMYSVAETTHKYTLSAATTQICRLQLVLLRIRAPSLSRSDCEGLLELPSDIHCC